MTNKVDVIVDLQFGSTGKGLIAGYLAKLNKYDMVINANMPNAGHTFIDATGREWIHKVLPNGIVSDSVQIVGLGAGSVFKLEQLDKEYSDSSDLMLSKKLIIHESAVVLSEEHRNIEQQNMSKISSTMQGSGAALIEKIMRNPESTKLLAKDALKGTKYEHNVVSNAEWLKHLFNAESILLEGAQGYSLGVSSGFWPYCTSRDCTPARFLADCGVPVSWLRDVIGTARCHPIRVGSTPDGYSGDVYSDQEETTWEEIGVPAELTTVTKRERRVFTFSEVQMQEAILACQPTKVFLNFCNYDDDLAEEVTEFINFILNCYGPEDARVEWRGWQATELDIEEM